MSKIKWFILLVISIIALAACSGGNTGAINIAVYGAFLDE
jgi:hypothetical protein